MIQKQIEIIELGRYQWRYRSNLRQGLVLLLLLSQEELVVKFIVENPNPSSLKFSISFISVDFAVVVKLCSSTTLTPFGLKISKSTES